MNKPSKNQKKRLCWNCEGNIDLDEEVCPFCGVSVIPASLDTPPQSFAPPYRFGAASENAIPSSPYSAVQEKGEEVQSAAKLMDDEAPPGSFRASFIAIALLLSGSVFFLFGLVLMLFSHKGVLTLQWNGDLWFVYSGISLFLLILGWRALLKLDDEK